MASRAAAQNNGTRNRTVRRIASRLGRLLGPDRKDLPAKLKDRLERIEEKGKKARALGMKFIELERTSMMIRKARIKSEPGKRKEIEREVAELRKQAINELKLGNIADFDPSDTENMDERIAALIDTLIVFGDVCAYFSHEFNDPKEAERFIKVYTEKISSAIRLERAWETLDEVSAHYTEMVALVEKEFPVLEKMRQDTGEERGREL